jgi:hypothetical protein
MMPWCNGPGASPGLCSRLGATETQLLLLRGMARLNRMAGLYVLAEPFEVCTS